MVARRHSDDSASNPCRELAYFLTTGIVISAFALPIVLSRAPVAVTPPPPTETDSSAIITTTLAPNTTTTTTVIGFFITFDGDDVQYSVW